MPESFFVVDGERVIPTEFTRGPWDPGAQHGGPPSAILGRAIEQCEPREGFVVARIAFDILRPVPLVPLSIEARVARPGRNVELVEAFMRDGDGREIMRASAWKMRATEVADDMVADPHLPIPRPDEGTEMPPAWETGTVGYHTAMEWKYVKGSFLELGPATAWLRMRWPLVEGESPSPLQRVLIAADSGNGISSALDFSEYVFINTDLIVQLQRAPEGEWIGLDARTVGYPGGAGLAESVLFDTTGPIGRGSQTLFLAARR